MFAQVKNKMSTGYQNSVIRRTFLQAAIIVPGFAANFFIYFFAGRLLASDEFGLFYVALTLGNVLFSGSLILNVFFTRHLVHVIQLAGKDAAFHAIRKIEKVVILSGLVFSTLIFFGFSIISNYIGVQSRLVILLIILDAYTSFIADLGRVFFQAIGHSITLGLYTTIWMVLKLALCIGAIWMFNTVWAGLLGQVLSAVVMFTCFRIWITLSACNKPTSILSMPSPMTLLVPALGYSMMIIVSNMDVLVSYFLLSANDLGVYSASSVFPKAILVVITPLLQMLFPMMVGMGKLSRDVKVVIGKTVAVTLILTLIAVFIIWILSGWLCGGQWGLRLCQEPPLYILLLSAVPVALLRVIVMLQFARGREMFTLWLVVPILFYLPFSWISGHTIIGIAESYAWASTLTLLLYLGVYLAIEFRLNRQPIKFA